MVRYLLSGIRWRVYMVRPKPLKQGNNRANLRVHFRES
jgi:hypothetical protein